MPTAKLHSYREYFDVQEWLGKDDKITTGWDVNNLSHGRLSPTQTEQSPQKVF